MMRLPSILLLSLAACQTHHFAVAITHPQPSVSQPIIGGTSVATGAEPAIFMLVELLTYDYQSEEYLDIAGCAATLVASKTLATTARCVDPRADAEQLTDDPSSVTIPSAVEILGAQPSEF